MDELFVEALTSFGKFVMIVMIVFVVLILMGITSVVDDLTSKKK